MARNQYDYSIVITLVIVKTLKSNSSRVRSVSCFIAMISIHLRGYGP